MPFIITGFSFPIYPTCFRNFLPFSQSILHWLLSLLTPFSSFDWRHSIFCVYFHHYITVFSFHVNFYFSFCKIIVNPSSLYSTNRITSFHNVTASFLAVLWQYTAKQQSKKDWGLKTAENCAVYINWCTHYANHVPVFPVNANIYFAKFCASFEVLCSLFLWLKLYLPLSESRE